MHEKKEETYIVKNKDGDFMKRIFKNIVSVLLLLCLAFSIVACGEEAGNGMTEEERIAYENIEKYHAEIIEHSNFSMKIDYITKNRTKGNRYSFNEGFYEGKAEDNDLLPEYRVNIVLTQEEFEEAFFAFPEINFEKEMIIVYFYTSYANREKSLQGITINEGELQINIKTKNPPKGVEDGRTPITSWIVIKMDKIEYGVVKIIA